jgi:hypothetical protein
MHDVSALTSSALLAIPWDLLVLSNNGDLGRTWTLVIKHVSQKLLCQSPCQLDTNDSLTQSEDLTIIGQD